MNCIRLPWTGIMAGSPVPCPAAACGRCMTGEIFTMERFLEAYIERIRPSYTGFSPETAHEIASAFLAFRFGLYANAARECTSAMGMIPDSEPNAALKKALAIIRANAVDRENSLASAEMGIGFAEPELRFVAVRPPQEMIENPDALGLDNALILVYVVALVTSPDDEEALGEHRRTIVRMLDDYKKALGLE